MMRCYLCGRALKHPAVTITRLVNGAQREKVEGHAGPTCARNAGLLPPRAKRPRTAAPTHRKARHSGQMEMSA